MTPGRPVQGHAVGPGLTGALAATGPLARGLLPSWLVSGALALAALLSGAVPLAVAAGMLALLAVSVIVHELGHLCAFRILDRHGPAFVHAEGFRSSVLRPSLGHPRDRAITLAGPFAPLTVGLLSVLPAVPAVLAGAPIHSIPLSVWIAWLAIGLGHAASLLAPAGDGAALRATARRSP